MPQSWESPQILAAKTVRAGFPPKIVRTKQRWQRASLFQNSVKHSDSFDADWFHSDSPSERLSFCRRKETNATVFESVVVGRTKLDRTGNASIRGTIRACKQTENRQKIQGIYLKHIFWKNEVLQKKFQVWFKNRRAKARQQKKANESTHQTSSNGSSSSSSSTGSADQASSTSDSVDVSIKIFKKYPNFLIKIPKVKQRPFKISQ